MIKVVSGGPYTETLSYLKRLQNGSVFDILSSYGPVGVELLSSATPVETGLTSHSWTYTVTHTVDQHILSWDNTHEHEGVNIAVIIQYGHGTGTGGYVEGIDYINPALRPLFDKIVENIWREVANA